MDDILKQIESDASPDTAAAFVRLATDYLARTRGGEGPVSTTQAPAALAARFDEPLPLHGSPVDDVVRRIAEQVLPDVNRLYHPMYIGHQVSAPLPAAIWTDAIVSAVNNSLAVAEMSPAFTAIEGRVVRWMCDLVGFGKAAGGTLTSGGTEATFAALLAARAALLPDAWELGVAADGTGPVVLCGEHAHYAVARAVGQMGLGTRNLVLLPSRDYRMDVDALSRALDEQRRAGRPVMAVVATAGSTATGAFDDLEAIADLCERHGTWLHVDGAHGASALLSDAHRHRMRGIARARSLAWDPHKMMLLPLSAGVVLVREERELERAFAQRAPYLFHGDEGERIVDQGVRSFQCSRRADALKVWVALQRYGAAGIGALYDGLCARAAELHALLEARDDFETLHAPESNILCFRWTGGRSSGAVPTDDAALDRVNRELREAYNRSGAGWITATVLGGRRVLRVTVMNPRTGRAELERLVEGLSALGSSIARETATAPVTPRTAT